MDASPEDDSSTATITSKASASLQILARVVLAVILNAAVLFILVGRLARPGFSSEPPETAHMVASWLGGPATTPSAPDTTSLGWFFYFVLVR